MGQLLMNRRARKTLRTSPDMADALNAALHLLSYRPRSENEIRSRLRRRFCEDDVEGVVDYLKERDLLNDRAFASYWRDSREANRPRSNSVLRYEMLRMGVAREVAEEALEGYDEEGNAYQAARKIAPRLSGLDYPAFRNKLTVYLGRRGFSRSTVRSTVDGIWAKLTDPDDCAVAS